MRSQTVCLLIVGLLVSSLSVPSLAQSARAEQPLTLKLLNQRLPEVEFIDQPLDQVIEYLGELMQINMVVRWQMLEDIGVERDKLVSLKAKDLRFSQVMWLLLNEAGSEVKLAYRASGRLLVLSTEEDLSKEMIIKVYDVADLLIRIPNASRNAAFDVTQGMGESGSGGGGSSGMFGEGNQNDTNNGNDQNQNQDQQAQIDELVLLITSTVEPDSWVQNGGIGTIQPFQRLLVVRNSLLVHQRLGGYLTEDEVTGP